MRLLSSWRWAGFLAVAICACRTTPEPAGSAPTGNSAPAARSAESTARTEASPGDVTWTKPSGWSAEPNATGMRKATYKVPRASGDADDATVSVIQAGGTVDANVERWYGQFQGVHDQKRTQLRVGPLRVTVVEAHGTYTGGGVMVGESPAPKPGWSMLGAIVEIAPQPYFFKMLGPEKTVSAARGDFQALLGSLVPR
ncbi:MAG TPA: hypothetical protein VLM85_22485 [Polyangiaceae bacterium]|nr:hypothetical protein [Polyangiaceae bacterium]